MKLTQYISQSHLELGFANTGISKKVKHTIALCESKIRNCYSYPSLSPNFHMLIKNK